MDPEQQQQELPAPAAAAPAGGSPYRVLLICVGILAAILLAGVAMSKPPPRVEIRDTGNGQVSLRGQASFEHNFATGRFEMVPLTRQKGIEIVVENDLVLYGVSYRGGAHLRPDGKGNLVHQNIILSRWNDLRHTLWRLTHPEKGKP